ncbi:extracellular solute-binding protein [Chitiniphilus eburneus]|uniref:extracellular solute-binding protein n=1 Tax=Chitiniphilus eburneus TaxID=2571148 RepID=UPI0035CE8841
MMSLRSWMVAVPLAAVVAGFAATLGYVFSAGNLSGGTATIALLIALVSVGGIAAALLFGVGKGMGSLARIHATLQSLGSDHGDLNLRLPDMGDDEAGQIAKALNTFVSRQQGVLREVQREMEGLAIGLHEVAVVNEQMAKDARQQSDFAAASAATVQQITVSINHIADNARDVDEAVSDTQHTASESADAVSRVLEEVGGVASAMQELGTTMDSLGKRSQEISGIVGVIKDIAGQTNLLALNAAIEAARAGEQGRGFAVVADEVRKLAERTSTATVEIARMIESIGSETTSAVSSMGTTADQVNGSVISADDARKHMLGIGQRMEHVVEAVRQIAESTREQSSATTTMAHSAEQINNMTQATDSALRQSGQTLAQLDGRASKLLDLVGKFKLADIEVLHWWLSSSEARAVSEVKALLNKQGHHWMDARSSGENPMASLKTRVQAGNSPTAAAIGGVKIQNWARDGVCADLTEIAREQGWSRVLPAVFDQMIQADGKYVAVPLGTARTNMLWVNAQIVNRLNLRPPTSWDDFFVMADKLKQAGIPVLAHSEQSWQVATVFEAIALGQGGADFYRAAFSQLDQGSLTGAKMIKALETLKRLKPYVTPDPVGRDWNLATADVINGRAAMQLMGDWSKAEFVQAGKEQGRDYLCWPAPTQSGDYSFAADTLTMFKQTDPLRHAAQRDFVRLLMSQEGQEVFNLYKGNIPARTDVNMTRYDEYARQSSKDFAAAANKGVLVPSWAHNMAVQDNVRSAFFDVIGAYWGNANMSAQDAARRLGEAARR